MHDGVQDNTMWSKYSFTAYRNQTLNPWEAPVNKHDCMFYPEKQ